MNCIMLSLLSILLLLSLKFSSSTHQDFLNCLQSKNNVTINSEDLYTPNNANYSSIWESPIHNLRPRIQYSSLSPNVIVTPMHESEIQAVIYCSKKHGLLMKIRSGGHDYEGLSYTSTIPFVILDMRNIRSITIDTKNKSAWIESGATLGELYHAIAEKSQTLAFVAGTSPTVGVGGHFSGGGYGMMSRRFGLSVDHIVDARIMDVNGRIHDRKTMGEELFWAIRGGGGTSFGVIIAWNVNLLDVPEKVTTFKVARTLEENAMQLVQRWQYIGNTIDHNLLIRLFITSIPSNTTSNNRTISVSFTSMYIGGVKDLLRIMQNSFPELGLTGKDCTEMSWIKSILFFEGYNPEEISIDVLLERTQLAILFKGKSDYVTHPISEAGLRGLWNRLHETDKGWAQIQFSPYGGEMAEISESETPFPHRKGNLYIIHYEVIWVQENEIGMNVKWIRDVYGYMAAHVSKSPRRAYMNYRDLDLGVNNIAGNASFKQASKWGTRYFDKNFNRLVRVKNKIDPTNFFRNEQSIPSISIESIPYIKSKEEIVTSLKSS